jgi:hypothetical protein
MCSTAKSIRLGELRKQSIAKGLDIHPNLVSCLAVLLETMGVVQ